MSGKVTKDIFMRVGQGVMRIPRNAEELSRTDYSTPEQGTTSGSAAYEHNQVGDETPTPPCQDSQDKCL